MKNFLKCNNLILIFFLTGFFLFTFCSAEEKREQIHKNREALPSSCNSCHVRAEPTEVRAIEGEERFCYFCHGSEERRKKSKQTRRITPKVSLLDISAEFSKPSHHPVERRGIHYYREILPEVNPKILRHSECQDCHKPHCSYPKIKVEKGKKKPGNQSDLENEYELCYKCHSYSANLPAGRTNKAIEFQLTNPSYHPVESEGKNLNLPSLLAPLKAGESIINCTDCHNNDNQKGPSGPHGSIYPPILIKNYVSADDYPESEFIYALCYECHSRKSILNNESFPYHFLHIVEKKNSCYSCHNSHGSPTNPHLIEFRLDRSEADSFGRFEFIDRGEFRGECYLKCHPAEKGGIEHSPKSY